MIQTIYSCQKKPEQYVMPSTTIPHQDIDAVTALHYLQNDEPIPARFLSRRIHDEDLDGVLDVEARMFDILDLKFARSAREQQLYEKYGRTDVAESAKKLRLKDKEKDNLQREPIDKDVLNENNVKEKNALE